MCVCVHKQKLPSSTVKVGEVTMDYGDITCHSRASTDKRHDTPLLLLLLLLRLLLLLLLRLRINQKIESKSQRERGTKEEMR